MLPDSSKLFHCGNNGRWNACQMVRLNALWRKITMIYWSLSTQESCVMSRCHFRDDYYLSIRINSLICDFSVSFFFFFSFFFLSHLASSTSRTNPSIQNLHPTETSYFIFRSRLTSFIHMFLSHSRSVLRSCPPPRSISPLES